MKSDIRSNRLVLKEMSIPQVSGKLFESVASWVTGRSANNISLVGTATQVEVIQEAMAAARDFHVTLHDPEATLDEVSVKLQAKHAAAALFEETFATKWPL
jgi:hypothetical protein